MPLHAQLEGSRSVIIRRAHELQHLSISLEARSVPGVIFSVWKEEARCGADMETSKGDQPLDQQSAVRELAASPR